MDAPTPPDLAAIGALIREELDRGNKYLDFAQGQIAKDREFYKHLYTYAFAFITFMILVAGYFQYTSVTQMRNDTKASVDAQLARSQAEIDAIRARANTANVEAQATVLRELASVRTEVQKRIDSEFQSENLKALVTTAAKEHTARELTGIIRSETSTQVAKGIHDQQPLIDKAVQDQTRQAVIALEPTINSVITKDLDARVQNAVLPLEKRIKELSLWDIDLDQEHTLSTGLRSIPPGQVNIRWNDAPDSNYFTTRLISIFNGAGWNDVPSLTLPLVIHLGPSENEGLFCRLKKGFQGESLLHLFKKVWPNSTSFRFRFEDELDMRPNRIAACDILNKPTAGH
jgi:hypothetical protein